MVAGKAVDVKVDEEHDKAGDEEGDEGAADGVAGIEVEDAPAVQIQKSETNLFFLKRGSATNDSS